MAVETVLLADSERALDYTRVNPKDQPLKFLHPDGSVTDSQNVNVTASALPEGAATEAKQDATIAKIQEVVDNTQSIEVSVGDVDLNTDALEAKADLLLTELKLKANLTETQPVTLKDYEDHPIDTDHPLPINNFSITPDDIDAAKTLGSLDFGAPFNIGLTIVVGGNAKCTVVYE